MKVKIVDNAISEAAAETIRRYICNSKFGITGWEDRFPWLEHYDGKIHSQWSETELANSGFTVPEDLEEQVRGRRPWNIVVNLTSLGETHYEHVHPGSDVLLYYPDVNWRREWGGETLFYMDSGGILTLEYTPKRAVYFDGEIPHTIRPPTKASPHYRTTLSIFYRKGD